MASHAGFDFGDIVAAIALGVSLSALLLGYNQNRYVATTDISLPWNTGDLDAARAHVRTIAAFRDRRPLTEPEVLAIQSDEALDRDLRRVLSHLQIVSVMTNRRLLPIRAAYDLYGHAITGYVHTFKPYIFAERKKFRQGVGNPPLYEHLLVRADIWGDAAAAQPRRAWFGGYR